MGIMNVVWPATALYLSVVGLWAYFRLGRHMTKEAQVSKQMKSGNSANASKQHLPWPQIAVADSHCGAGCAIADVVAEFLVFGLGLSIAGVTLWADYSLDLACAWLLGIVFQYFTIKPMLKLSVSEGILAAIKADTLSIISFQVGMYAWMAAVYFLLFPKPHLHPNEALYWFMMQIGMIAGYLTAFPMNGWLLKRGFKESMG